jgi:hypothetical protein
MCSYVQMYWFLLVHIQFSVFYKVHLYMNICTCTCTSGTGQEKQAETFINQSASVSSVCDVIHDYLGTAPKEAGLIYLYMQQLPIGI